MELSFEAMLPRLVASYERGRLVPFLGAGMSADRCVLWPELVAGLERGAFGNDAPTKASDARGGVETLVRRANAAVFRLRLAGAAVFHEAVHSALLGPTQNAPGAAGPGRIPLPPQTAALAGLYWPLVLTTNYDDLFLSAWNQAFRKGGSTMQVLGRSPEDCRRVLTSLHKSRAPVLWALQGHLPGQDPHVPSALSSHMALLAKDSELGRYHRRLLAGGGATGHWTALLLRLSKRDFVAAVDQMLADRREARAKELRDQLVVGHAEYRRVAIAEPHFRRAFAEVFRTRSFLFLGSSLADPYLLDLFGEVLEVFGPNPFPHYALVKRGEVDLEFLRQRLNTLAVEYDEHQHLPERLKELSGATRQSARTDAWSFSVGQPGKSGTAAARAGVDLVRGALRRHGDREAVAVLVQWGSAQSLLLGERARRELSAFGVTPKKKARPPEAGRWVTHLAEQPALLVNTAVVSSVVNPTRIGSMIAELMEAAAAAGFDLVRITAPTDDVSARFFVMAAIAGYGHCYRQPSPPAVVRLAIHVADTGVLFDLATGRIDPGELLLADDLRLMVEIISNEGTTFVEAAQYSTSEDVAAIASSFGIPATDWFVEIDPSPERAPFPLLLAKLKATGRAVTLAEIGAVSDAILRFIQMTPVTLPQSSTPTPAAATEPPAKPPEVPSSTTPDSAGTPGGGASPAQRTRAPAQRRKPRSRRSS